MLEDKRKCRWFCLHVDNDAHPIAHHAAKASLCFALASHQREARGTRMCGLSFRLRGNLLTREGDDRGL